MNIPRPGVPQLERTTMSIPWLGVPQLDGLPPAVKRPAYDRSAIQNGIVHLGIGAFMRCHLAVATDAALDSGDLRWGIVGVSLRQSDTRDALDPQDCLYTVAIRAHVQGQVDQSLQVIGAVTEVLLATQQSQRVLDCLSAQETRIVSLTVTEKGYCHDPATGTLQLNHPDIVYDIANPDAPRSAIGYIVRGLAVRRALGRRPVTLMSLDNLPSNGRILSNVVLGLAKSIDPTLCDWIAENCSFPCSMVDRIVPRTTDADRLSISDALGCKDAWPVLGEPFFDWAVEDNFVAGRPEWTLGGARFVADAEPWERLKLRMVNGAHSSIAYLSVMAGWETVGVAMQQAPLLEHIDALMRDEIEPTLPPLSGLNLATYRTQLLARYANPVLHHRTYQIAADGSQKLPQRLLDTIRDRLSVGQPVPRLALSVASWLYHLQGVDESGKIFVIDDPLVEPLTQLYQAALTDDLSDDSIQKLLAFSPVFGDNMMPPGFVGAVGAALKSLHTAGVLSTLGAVNREAVL
jgi:fructuronate reductase